MRRRRRKKKMMRKSEEIQSMTQNQYLYFFDKLPFAVVNVLLVAKNNQKYVVIFHVNIEMFDLHQMTLFQYE